VHLSTHLPTAIIKISLRLLPALLATAFFCGPAHGAEFYVSEKGRDANDGKSPNRPFLTLQHADGVVKPGDTVWIMAGTYRSPRTDKEGGALLEIRTSGKPDAWITWRAYKDAKPELIAQGIWHAILLNASYIVIDGLTLTGNNANVRQIDAEANGELDVKASRAAAKAEGEKDIMLEDATPNLDKTKGAAEVSKKPRVKPKSRPVTYQKISPIYSGNGITADFRDKKEFHHHYVLRNLVVRDFGTVGISMMDTDYYTIENSEVYNNAWYSPYGSSGISHLGGRNFDEVPGYHNIIRNNRVYNNKCLVRVYFIDLFSDGNGIILDSLNDYSGDILVENNLSYNNGGAGIHVFRSNKAHIDIVHNTLWRNQQMWRLYELGAHAATNINILNNIVVADRWRQVNSKAIPGVRYDYNLYFGSNQIEDKGSHDVFADPEFVLPSTNRKDGDFTLLPNSPAIDSASNELTPKTDLLGQPRPLGKAPDRGAYEYKSQ
jgi:hypothetical protein